VVAWSDGGITAQGNGRLLCGAHNRWEYANGRGGADPPATLPLDEPAEPEVWSVPDVGDARQRQHRRHRRRREAVPALPDLFVVDPSRPDTIAVAIDLGVACA
jgi:hypothetical protein